MEPPQRDPYPNTVNIEVTGSDNVVAGHDVIVNYHLDEPTFESRQGLLTLILRVKEFWIKGVLDQSTHNQLLLELGKEAEPGAVKPPWETVVELPDGENPVPTTEPVEQLFEQAGRLILILGDPGSGKTITLLQLARSLLAVAESDLFAPAPVYFNLSSWSRSRKSLLNWLVDELADRYRVGRPSARNWLEEKRLLLLLDGLDEVKDTERDACVKAINDFCASVGVPGIAVCSRTEEYRALSVQLKLNYAIHLLPLDANQIDDYLARSGPQLNSLREALRQHEHLRTLSRTPLMLSIMCLSYGDTHMYSCPSCLAV